MAVTKQSEREFTDQVIQLARLYGWIASHFRPARTEKGWRTPTQADGNGFPDLVLVRGRVIYAELKAEDGHTRPEQERWIAAFEEAGQEVYVWRPSDWDSIREILK